MAMVSDYSNKSVLGFHLSVLKKFSLMSGWSKSLISVYHFIPCFIDCVMFIILLHAFHFPFVKQVSCLKHFLSLRSRESSIVFPFNVLFCPVLFCGQGCRFRCNVRGKNIYRNILTRMYIECRAP